MLVELPWLREGVRALRGPRGLLLHDAYRWGLFHLPAELPAAKREGFRRRHGLEPGSTATVRPRLRQLFDVETGLLPSRELRIPPGMRFSCACCGASCRSMRLGPLLPADVERLKRLEWSGTGRDPDQFFVDWDDAPLAPGTPGKDVFLRRVAGKRCQFLRDDELCEVHARFGAQAKPLMCRMFPYLYRATPTGISVRVRLSDCASSSVASRGLPVLEQRPDLTAMLAELETLPFVPPSIWVSRGRLLAFEEYERIEAGLARLPAQDAPGGFAAAVLRAFDPARPASGLDRLLERAGLAGTDAAPLHPAALELEDRICRSRLLGKELFATQDLSWGAALLVIQALLARLSCDGTADSLNRAWKDSADWPIRDWLRGLDVPGIAARIAS